MKKYFGIALILVALFPNALAKSPTSLPENADFVAEKAEDVIDFYIKGDWPGAQAIVESMSLKEKSVVAILRNNQMPGSSADNFYYFMFRLKALTQQKKDPIQSALVANQITNLLIDLHEPYAHQVPLQVARMDYLGREIVLLARVSNNCGLLNRRIAELDRVWKSLRETILKKGGEKVASQVDQVIKEMQKGVSGQQMVRGGNTILDLVDELEALFK